MTPATSRLAYLLSEYPHIRHAYLLREVRGLRKLGFEIATIAIRGDSRNPADCTSEEREERESCFYVLSAGWGTIFRAHGKTLLTNPRGWFAGLGRALGYGDFQPRRTLSGLYYFAEAVVAGWWISGRGISQVHSHYASTVAWIMASVFPLDVSMTIHGSGEFNEPRCFRLAEKIEAARFVRAISFFGRSQLLRATPYSQWNKIEMCRLGVDPASFQPRCAPSGEPVELLCVGGMATPRSFHVILQAVASVPGATLRLVGDGPDRATLEKLTSELRLADRVFFDGWKNQDQLREIYSRADAFVFSSFAEGIPVVLMEAMATALPCIAPRITGIPELIRDGVDGFLYSASDAHGLAEAMRRLVQNPDLCRSMGKSARSRVMELYDLNLNIAELAAIFRRRECNTGVRGASRPASQR